MKLVYEFKDEKDLAFFLAELNNAFDETSSDNAAIGRVLSNDKFTGGKWRMPSGTTVYENVFPEKRNNEKLKIEIELRNPEKHIDKNHQGDATIIKNPKDIEIRNITLVLRSELF